MGALRAATVVFSGVFMAAPFAAASPEPQTHTAHSSPRARVAPSAHATAGAGQKGGATAAAPAKSTPHSPLVTVHSAATAPVMMDDSGKPMLTLVRIGRSDRLAVPALGRDGGFLAEDLDRVSEALASGNGDTHPIDSRTLSILYRIQVNFGVSEIRILSGYRTPKPGNNSNHGKGRAIDFIVPGVPDEQVARYAREVGFVGVGVYPTSQFLHVDIRPRSYFWLDASAPGAKNKERGILGDVAKRTDEQARSRSERPPESFEIAKNVDEFLRRHSVAEEHPPVQDEEEEE